MTDASPLPTEEVVVVRLYLARSVERRELLFRRLQHWEKLRGATVLQAEQGFGEHGVARGDLAPAIIEFFDTRAAAERVISDIQALVDHIIFWPAEALCRSEEGTAAP